MEDIIGWVFGWYNLPFLVTLGIALGFVLIETVTGGLSDMFPSFDLGLDIDIDANFDVDLDIDAGVSGAPAWAVGLGWMGFGKAPFTVLIEVMFASFGMTGLLVTAIAHDIYPGLDKLSLVVALPVAAFVAVFVTKTVGALIYKYIPPSASTVKDPGSYVGHPASAVVRLTPDAGEVKVDGDHQPVFLKARAHETIPQGSDVVLVGFDAATHVYRAEPV